MMLQILFTYSYTAFIEHYYTDFNQTFRESLQCTQSTYFGIVLTQIVADISVFAVGPNKILTCINSLKHLNFDINIMLLINSDRKLR
jgi:hypothetical protein